MAATPEYIHPPDAIVTLGFQLLDDGSPQPELLERVETAADLFKDLLSTTGAANLVLVMSGGSFESRVMKRHAASLGVSEKSILEEDGSLSTWGNAWYTNRIAKRLRLRRLVVVTSSDTVTTSYLFPRN
jgi:uncharacterized SAM-binding protein YcdF (DUF218 family)